MNKNINKLKYYLGWFFDLTYIVVDYALIVETLIIYVHIYFTQSGGQKLTASAKLNP